jgi:hypothetical protein
VRILIFTGSTSADVQSLRESLPDEDPETQAVLMKHVLGLLLEIEGLTLEERASAQDNLAGLQSHGVVGTLTQRSQPRYAFFPHYQREPLLITVSALWTPPQGQGRSMTFRHSFQFV